MVIRGRFENGVVVFDDEVSLPEGTEVTVVVCAEQPSTVPAMSDEQRQRLIDAFQRIATLPIEGSTNPFSGADHDRVLYGNP